MIADTHTIIKLFKKKGLSNYFWSDFLTSGLLGGILAVILLLALIFVAKTGIDYNPFIKDAVHAYQEMFKDAICGKVYWGDKMIGECNNYLIWWSLGCIGFFLAGFWFGLISALVAFLSDNKVFVYAMPIIVTMIIDKWAYIFTIIFKNNETICNLLYSIQIRPNYSLFGDLNHLVVLALFCILTLGIGFGMQKKITLRYLEEGAA